MMREPEHMMYVVILRQSVCSSWRRDSFRGRGGGWDLIAVFNNLKKMDSDVSQEHTTKGQKATWMGWAQEFAGRAIPIRYKEGKVHHERS